MSLGEKMRHLADSVLGHFKPVQLPEIEFINGAAVAPFEAKDSAHHRHLKQYNNPYEQSLFLLSVNMAKHKITSQQSLLDFDRQAVAQTINELEHQLAKLKQRQKVLEQDAVSLKKPESFEFLQQEFFRQLQDGPFHSQS